MIHNSLIHVVVLYHVLTYYAHVKKKQIFLAYRVSYSKTYPIYCSSHCTESSCPGCTDLWDTRAVEYWVEAAKHPAGLCADHSVTERTKYLFTSAILRYFSASAQVDVICFVHQHHSSSYCLKWVQCSPVVLFTHNAKTSKVPLTKTVTLTVRVNDPLPLLFYNIFPFLPKLMYFALTVTVKNLIQD